MGEPLPCGRLPSRHRRHRKGPHLRRVPDIALNLVDSHTFDGRLQLLEYVPRCSKGRPASATRCLASRPFNPRTPGSFNMSAHSAYSLQHTCCRSPDLRWARQDSNLRPLGCKNSQNCPQASDLHPQLLHAMPWLLLALGVHHARVTSRVRRRLPVSPEVADGSNGVLSLAVPHASLRRCWAIQSRIRWRTSGWTSRVSAREASTSRSTRRSRTSASANATSFSRPATSLETTQS